MPCFVLSLISNQAIEPRLGAIHDIIKQQEIAIIESKHLHVGFEGAHKDAYPDAYSLILLGLEADVNKLVILLTKMHDLDVMAQPEMLANTPKRLACFDMDSTLIAQETMDELANYYGIGEKIAAITESAMRGEMSFVQSFRQRLACLKGFSEADFSTVARELHLTSGANTLVTTLKAHGCKVVILSGGFENFAQGLQAKLGQFDAIYANQLEVEGGQLTGNISNTLVDEARKVQLLQKLAKRYKIPTEQTLAVGDGANDIPMLQMAGLGIAYHAKPIVQQKISYQLNHCDLSAVLFTLGFERSQFVTNHENS